MRNSEWEMFCNELASYYERKHPSQETLDLWSSSGRIADIPMEAASWIYDQITTKHDAFPKNLPMVMVAIWYEWRKLNPDKLTRGVHDCHNPNCKDGWLWLYFKDERVYPARVTPDNTKFAVAKCGDCQYLPGKKYTMAQAREAGYWEWTEEEEQELALTRYDLCRQRESQIKARALFVKDLPPIAKADFLGFDMDGAEEAKLDVAFPEMTFDASNF